MRQTVPRNSFIVPRVFGVALIGAAGGCHQNSQPDSLPAASTRRSETRVWSRVKQAGYIYQSGYYHGSSCAWRETTCPVCNGTGDNSRAVAPPYLKCIHCGGTGRSRELVCY